MRTLFIVSLYFLFAKLALCTLVIIVALSAKDRQAKLKSSTSDRRIEALINMHSSLMEESKTKEWVFIRQTFQVYYLIFFFLLSYSPMAR